MRTNKILKYPLIVLLILVSFNVSSQIKNQEQFASFLTQAELPSCFENIDYHHVEELFLYGKTRFESFDITSNYDNVEEVLELNTRENCHDTRSLQLKYVDYLTGEYIFLYRQHKDGEHNYGTVKLYEFKDSVWSEGKNITISWEELFDLDKDKLEDLHELDQYPKCMMTFKKTGMRIEIPWELYTYGDGSESNGYVQGRGKHPITIRYSYFL